MDIGTTDALRTALADRYMLTREIGAGGMAVVYLAHDLKLDRDVALKVLRPELGAVLGAERFLTEIKISARLDHPHILTLIDSGDAAGFLFYVLPFVRGESLRTKLDREKQLGLEEALQITKQVASALDYAHRQGLVHRDIKPENILLQEGEAMLADFGIALAVKEAGGNRLTQTGLSLGTPQYMSPEQATGDRGIDARSDVYSLASVLYEMLAGEPPVTGANAQSMIAKLMTEKPTSLRVLRDTVPPAIDAAVAKALAKTPADRFESAGAFVRALEKPSAATPSVAAAPGGGRTGLLAAGAVAALAIVLGGAYALRGRAAPAATAAVLGQRTQLTTTGAVLAPAISPDGKQLAHLAKHCAGADCTFSVVVQDVGGSTTRAILEGATAGYALEWSPDRRNLIFGGTINGRVGTYLLSALGGAPRFLTGGVATFFAGGDSLLIAPVYRADSVFYVRVASLDGRVADSVRVAGPGQGMQAVANVPGTNWIVTLVVQSPRGLWQVSDRSGKVVDQVINQCTCGGVATSDAVWLARLGDGEGESIVRIALDRATGRLAAKQDTMVTGFFTGFSLTADGASMVMDEGTYDYALWALPFADLMKGRFAAERRVAQSSGEISASLAPDGARLLVRRTVPVGTQRVEPRLSVMPFAGGSEAPLVVTGVVGPAGWVDSTSVAVATRSPTGTRLSVVDVQTHAQRNTLDLPDVVVWQAIALPDGWAWIPSSRDRVMIERGGKRHEVPVSPAFSSFGRLAADIAHDRLMVGGYNRSTADSAGLATISLTDYTVSPPWLFMSAENAWVRQLADGSTLMTVAATQESLEFYKVTGPGQVTRLGRAPRPLQAASVSTDLAKIVAQERNYRADAWLYKVTTK